MINSYFSEKRFRLFSLLLFFILFVYLILRALFVEIMYDEAATFLHYIETGRILGETSILDANNHLFISYLCRIIYKIFGENLFLFRLPSLLAFPVYFWAIYQLVPQFKNAGYRMIVLLGATCIPFILEYFAYCRGYGIALAFFMASLVFLTQISNKLSIRLHFLFIVSTAICCYANLSFLLSASLGLAFILLHQFLQRKTLNKKQHLALLLGHFLFLLLLTPAFMFAQTLKKGGALYYGTLDGFWEVTGSSLSRFTLFTEHYFVKWGLFLLILTLVFLLIKHWIQLRSAQFFRENNTLIAWFIFGNIAAILILAHVMDVHYPQDRVAMYLVPLLILLVAGLIEKLNVAKYLIFGFLFFPIMMLTKLNLNSSVFLPHEQMSTAFYQQVGAAIDTDKTSIEMYPWMNLTWAMHNRKSSRKIMVPIYSKDRISADIILSRKSEKLDEKMLANYDTLCTDKSNDFIAFKRKKSRSKTILFDTTLTTGVGNFQYIDIAKLNIPDSLKQMNCQFHVKGKLISSQPTEEIVLSLAIHNKDGEPNHIDSWTMHWYNGKNEEQQFLLNYPLDQWGESDDELRIYFYNPHGARLKLKECSFQILKIE